MTHILQVTSVKRLKIVRRAKKSGMKGPISYHLLFVTCIASLLVIGDTQIEEHKVHVDLYYESLCPDCSGFITTQLKPTWNKLSAIMSISLYPYGNAREHKLSNGTYVYSCQHGKDECFGNFVEACIMKLNEFDADQYMPIIGCIEEGVDTGKGIKETIQSCLQSLHVSKKSQLWIMECATVRKISFLLFTALCSSVFC